jgi:hypothetical protein
MYVLARELCVFILAAYLKRSEILARLDGLDNSFFIVGKHSSFTPETT